MKIQEHVIPGNDRVGIYFNFTYTVNENLQQIEISEFKFYTPQGDQEDQYGKYILVPADALSIQRGTIDVEHILSVQLGELEIVDDEFETESENRSSLTIPGGGDRILTAMIPADPANEIEIHIWRITR